MKKYNLEATDENILKAIETDQLHRTQDVIDFLTMLDTIDYSAFVALDAAWGEGKTFFVRQVEIAMRYHNKKTFGKEIEQQEITAFEANSSLGNIELQHTYYPIYFDSWLYDNHVNALMALLMVAIKQCGKTVNTIISNTQKVEKVAAIFDSIQFWKCNNWSNLLEKFKTTSILEETLLLEDVRQKVKEIFEQILVEDAEKLVFFIDELDRCKPTFAIEMLESIKHYFDDDRFIFVMSVNKSQLTHTIKKYYGNDFDSNLYLNKFFDINIHLPKADTVAYFNKLDISCDSNRWIKKFANELQKYYSLSLRDTTNYFQKICLIYDKFYEDISSCTLMPFVIPILCIFDIIDGTITNRILSGNGFDIIEKLVEKNESMRQYVMRLSNSIDDTEENYKKGMEELREFYKVAFSDDNKYGCYEGCIDIPANFKSKCLHICNSV